jgi:class 3 adenylate cyclase/tetratricopeptide (TPR) repeat protein
MHYCGKCGFALTSPEDEHTTADSLEEKPVRIERYLLEGLIGKTLSSPDRIAGERRQVTALFCDMKGFTALTEAIGGEKMLPLVNRIFTIMGLAVHRHEGTVSRKMGDGILALFGASEALEDAPQRAVRASIAIHESTSAFNETLKADPQIPPVLLRIGIDTGTVAIGAVEVDRQGEFTLVGDAINVASRMEALAEPGTTYVTEEIYRETKDLFDFQEIGRKTVKGKKEAIWVYKVISARRDVYRPRLGSERQIYARMVGRDSELDTLQFQVMSAIRGEGSVVNIIGEAGIGKSRLIAELKAREVVRQVAFFEGRAISIGKNLSYHPIIDLLRQWAGIRANDGEEKAFDKLEAAVRRLFPETSGEILPFIAILMGMKLWGSHAQRAKGIEGEPLASMILGSVRALLVKAAAVTPLVIVMEDLHWADVSSVEMLESLFRLSGSHRILFINLFRPGYAETSDRLTRFLKERHGSHYVEIALGPLPEKLSEELINIILKSKFQQAFVAEIVERTGGNPFFIEEVVRSLIDQHALLRKEDSFQLAEDCGTISIPNSIETLLVARIDRLEERTRDLVKEASVIGRTFFYRVLTEVAAEIEDIESRLAYLQEIQLLRERLRMGELEYLFNNALTQEVAYESILSVRRKELHLIVARAIEKVFDERFHDFYGMLAYHYSKAEDLEKAEECLIKAGEGALRSSASNEALHYYREALGIYQRLQGERADPEKVAMLQKNIGLALFDRGQYAEAVDYFDRALDYYWGKVHKNSLLRGLTFVEGFIAFMSALYVPSRWFRKTPGRMDTEAVDLFYKKGQALTVVSPKRLFFESFPYYRTIVRFDLTSLKFGIAIFAGASALFSFGGLSLSTGRRILDYAQPRLTPGDAKQKIAYDLMDTQHRLLEGQWDRIAECDDDLVNRNLRIGEGFFASQHYYWHGLPKVYRGDFHAARLFVTKLGEIAETYENDIYRLLKYLLNIQLLLECRQTKEAMAEVTRGIDLVQRKAWLVSEMTMESLKASIHLIIKETEEAHRSLDRADEIRRGVTAVPLQLSFFYRTRFEYDLCRFEESIKNGEKDAGASRRSAVRSGKMLVRTCRKAALFRADSSRLMGVCAWLSNDRNAASRWWGKALVEGEALGARAQLARTYAEMGARFGASPVNSGRAKESLQKAKDIFSDLGLHEDLANLDVVSSRMGIELSDGSTGS